MKTIVSFLVIILCFGACKKDAESATKTDNLAGSSSKKWKVIKYQRSTTGPVNSGTPDVIGTLSEFYRDNRMIFFRNGVEKMNEGASGPVPEDDYQTATWTFTDNETVINCMMLFGIMGNADTQLNCSIVEMSGEQMVLDNVFPVGPTTYYTRWTLVPSN